MILAEEHVRPCQSCHLSAIGEIELDAFGEPMTFSEIRKRALTRKDVSLFVSLIPNSDMAAGYAMISREKDRVILDRLVVMSRYRRMGHGSRLIWHIYSNMPIGGSVACYLPADNTPGIEFLSKLRMKRVRETRGIVVMQYKDDSMEQS